MSLSLNSRFGSYLVAESIGVGGMGEVYRATDTNLKREVAIKVLPESFAQDVDRLARFQREAEVLASLNHVNIAHIYGLERSAVETASVPKNFTALVMELVEGPTLAERLEQGPIPVDEALGIAMQIAEALEAAHERGIVHRDLKPANIKLRPDGLVKVLDFGIAKAMDNHASQSSGSHAPALTTPAMTEAGVILGTAAYMSPEQARGKAVDQRADIWALGCVLYEMLTGQPAFGAEDVTTTLARILERGVDLTALPASLSLDARQAIKLCLEKDVRKRIRHIGDVKLALTGAFETGTGLTTAAVVATAKRGRMAWFVAAASLAVIAAMTFPLLQHMSEEEPLPSLETRVDIVTPATEFPTAFALSPDGRQIVFVASDESGESQLWLRSLASTAAQPLAGTEGAIQPFWSPDGRSIGFLTIGELKRFDIGGGVQQSLATISMPPQGGAWGADNTLLVGSNVAGPLRSSAAGGAAMAFTTLAPGQTSHSSPHFLPDGRRFLFSATGSPETVGIYLGHLDGGAPVRLTASSSSGGVFHPDGWLLWNRAGTLTAQRLDLAQAVLTGEQIVLADGVVGGASMSTTGLIAYRTGSTSGRQLTWVDRSGTVLGTLGEPDRTMSNPRLSPDGRRVAVSRSVQGNTDLWLLDVARSSRFTFDEAGDLYPLWSPDGSRIVFRSVRTPGSPGDLYLKSSRGAGEDSLLLGSDLVKTANSWSADGRFLLYHTITTEAARDLWALPMTGDPTPFSVLQTPFDERFAEFSPDGRWIAYYSNESGRYEVYVRPFVTPDASSVRTAAVGGQWQISTEGGIVPVWSADGQELYYLDPAGNMMAAPILISADTIEVSAPVVLFPARIVGGGRAEFNLGRQYDVAPDGRFLINTPGNEGGDAPITLIQNWNPGAAQ